MLLPKIRETSLSYCLTYSWWGEDMNSQVHLCESKCNNKLEFEFCIANFLLCIDKWYDLHICYTALLLSEVLHALIFWVHLLERKIFEISFLSSLESAFDYKFQEFFIWWNSFIVIFPVKFLEWFIIFIF